MKEYPSRTSSGDYLAPDTSLPEEKSPDAIAMLHC